MRDSHDKSKKLFFYNYFSNLNISITMAYTVFKLCFLILHIHSEGTVSQIFHLGLISHFMPKIGKLFVQILDIIFKIT